MPPVSRRLAVLISANRTSRFCDSGFVLIVLSLYQDFAIVMQGLHQNFFPSLRLAYCCNLGKRETESRGNRGGQLDAGTKTQTEIWVVYGAHISSWFCFLFMIHTMNPPQRTVSAFVLAAFAAAAVYAIISGFVMRKKFFARSIEGDPSKAVSRWKAAHFIGFSCATSVTIFGVALMFLGAGWLVAGSFFAVGLSLLVLWRPRRTAFNSR
jgi:hypothetical protein